MRRVLDAAAKKQGTDIEGSVLFLPCSLVALHEGAWYFSCFAGSNTIAEDGLDGAKKDLLMPDLCVICLEQNYNSVFVP